MSNQNTFRPSLLVVEERMNEDGQTSEALSSQGTLRSERPEQDISFAHVQLFVDKLETLQVYKALEKTLNEFNERINKEKFEEGGSRTTETLQRQQHIWSEVSGSSHPPPEFSPHNRDIVTQLMVGFGFRVTRASPPGASRCPSGTRSVLLTSRDPKGVQLIVSAPDGEAYDEDNETKVQTRGFFSRGKLPLETKLLATS